MNIWATLALTTTVLLLSIAGFLTLTKPEPLSLSLNITTPNILVKAGQEITTSFSIQSNRKANITLNYSIISRSGRQVISNQKQIIIERSITHTIPIHIPEATPAGPYWLRTQATGESTTTTAILNIIISPPPKPKEASRTTPLFVPSKPRPRTPISPPPIILPTPQSSTNSPTQIVPQTTPPESSVSQQAQPTPPPTTPPSSLLPSDSSPKPIPASPDEIRTKLLTKAPQDPTGAAQDCTSFPPGEQDNCYSDVALAAKSSTICQRISDISTKDACLANLALNGDFSVCESIINIDIRDSCIALRGKTP